MDECQHLSGTWLAAEGRYMTYPEVDAWLTGCLNGRNDIESDLIDLLVEVAASVPAVRQAAMELLSKHYPDGPDLAYLRTL